MNPMYHYAVLFLITALVSAVFGFGVCTGVAAAVAKILSGTFFVLAVSSWVIGRRQK